MYGASFLCFVACLLYLVYFAGRRVFCVEVRRCRCCGARCSLPSSVFALLAVALALRAVWAALRWVFWNAVDGLDNRWMMVVLELPLLLQFSAFSAITLSWVNVHAIVSHSKHRATKFVLVFFTVSLFGMLAGAVIGSFTATSAQGRANWTKFDRHQLYHKIYLIMKAAFCLLLAVLFTVFGLRLRRRLAGSTHISESIRRSSQRIVSATLVCCFSFALRALIFGSTTILYNFMDLYDQSLDAYIYPLVVYTLPDCLTSGAIITIMFDTQVNEAEGNAGDTSAVSKHMYDGESNSTGHYSYMESSEEDST